MKVIRQYFKALWEIHVHPARYFRRVPTQGGIQGVLAFALVTHWLASALQYLWTHALEGLLTQESSELFGVLGDVAEIDHPGRAQKLHELYEQVSHWLWGIGAVIIDPFKTLLLLFFTSFFVYIGARILVTPGSGGSPAEIRFETALKVVALGSSPVILSAIPGFGPALAIVGAIFVTVIAAKEMYRIDYGRAVAVALFPKLLFLGIIVSGIVLGGLALLKLVSGLMS